MADRWLLFLRVGWSDGGGALVDRTVTSGFGYQINDRDSCLGIGLNWGRAPDVDRDQHMLESYFRAHILPGLRVVPSFQYVVDPANDPELANLWLLGLRLRAAW